MAAWSPDGKRIAFTIRIPKVMNDIYVIDITGDNFRRLTDHPWTRFVPCLVALMGSGLPSGQIEMEVMPFI